MPPKSDKNLWDEVYRDIPEDRKDIRNDKFSEQLLRSRCGNGKMRILLLTSRYRVQKKKTLLDVN